MSLLSQIKEQQIAARKNREEIKTSLLTTLLSEASVPGKNDNRESTDAEVVVVVKKFIKGVNETLEALKFSSDGRVKVAVIEKEILEGFLPQQLTEEEIRQIATMFVTAEEGKKDMKLMGKIQAYLKTNYAGQYDGALASKVIKEILA